MQSVECRFATDIGLPFLVCVVVIGYYVLVEIVLLCLCFECVANSAILLMPFFWFLNNV